MRSDQIAHFPEPLQISFALDSSAVRIFILRHFSIIAVEGILYRDVIGIASPASSTDNQVVSSQQATLRQASEVLAEKKSFFLTAADRAVSDRVYCCYTLSHKALFKYDFNPFKFSVYFIGYSGKVGISMFS